MSDSNSNRILESKLSWLLSIADRIQKYFVKQPDAVGELIEEIATARDAIVISGHIASDDYAYMIVAQDPKQLLMDLVSLIKVRDFERRDAMNPISIMTKLADREFMLDVAGNRLCYCVMSKKTSFALIKSLACRRIANISSFNSFVNNETFLLEGIEEVNPIYDYKTRQVTGGRQQPKKSHTMGQKKTGSVRLNLISKVVEHIKKDPSLASGIVFVNRVDECANAAMGILYKDRQSKDALVECVKSIVAQSFKHLTFKTFYQADFEIPYDFRMRKHSCFVVDKETRQNTYILNMYNSASYEVIPCTRVIFGDQYINIAHPIIKLRLLYIDMFIIETKMASASNNVFHSKLVKAYDEVCRYDKYPLWVGVFVDELYDKIKFNQKMNMMDPPIVNFV